MWIRKRKPSIIFCHLIVNLLFLLSHALVYLRSVRHFSLGDCFYFAVGCIMLLVGCAMLLCSFWSAILDAGSIQFSGCGARHTPNYCRHTQVCQAIHKINIWPRVTRHRHLTSWLMLFNFSSFFATRLFLHHTAHTPRFFFDGSYCANPIPSLEWRMLMWLFRFCSFFFHIHKIYFHSTICARNNQNFSHLTHFSLFVHVHSSQQSW